MVNLVLVKVQFLEMKEELWDSSKRFQKLEEAYEAPHFLFRVVTVLPRGLMTSLEGLNSRDRENSEFQRCWKHRRWKIVEGKQEERVVLVLHLQLVVGPFEEAENILRLIMKAKYLRQAEHSESQFLSLLKSTRSA